MAIWAREKNHLLQSIMLACAWLGHKPGFYAGADPGQVLELLKKSAPGLSSKYSGNNASPDYPRTITEFSDRITNKDWAKAVIPDPNNKAKQIPYWNYFLEKYLVPIIPAKTQLIIDTVKQAAPGAAKPGTAATKN